MPGPTPKIREAGPVVAGQTLGREPLELRVYRALTLLACPAAPLILRFRERNGKEDPARRQERLGHPSLPRPGGSLVWVHAASVGEASSVLPLMTRLAELRPDVELLLTTGTVTSATFVASRLPERCRHQYVPLDSPPLVGAFLDHWRPSIAVFTEQEIWPNLIRAVSSRGIPLALVNARMSETSFLRWQRRGAVAEALFSRFSVVVAQNEELAERFRGLGAMRCVAAGNLKVDAPPPPVDRSAFAALDAALSGRPRFLAASTHSGEEEAAVAAHRRLRAAHPGLVTIVAPRHPERGEAIAAAVAAAGLSVARRSADELPGPETEVYVADTIGELGTLYASAPLAFIGGSLVPHGGQNPIEAVRHGAAVLAGPFTHNFADAFRALVAADGARIVPDAEALAAAVAELLSDPERLAAMRAGASRALSALSGALERTAAILLPLLPEPVDPQVARRAN